MQDITSPLCSRSGSNSPILSRRSGLSSAILSCSQEGLNNVLTKEQRYATLQVRQTGRSVSVDRSVFPQEPLSTGQRYATLQARHTGRSVSVGRSTLQPGKVILLIL